MKQNGLPGTAHALSELLSLPAELRDCYVLPPSLSLSFLNKEVKGRHMQQLEGMNIQNCL